MPGQRLGDELDLERRALRNDPPTVLARPGAEVDDMVRGAHRLLVVLDHQDRIAEVAQALERRDELCVVALMEPDRWLVEDVEDPDERRADLRRETDPLRFAARERRRRAIHRQVADADVLEEAQALLDLAQHEPCDVALSLGQLDLREPVERGMGR